ncbi:FAD-dependent oxidoreductase [Inhella gelatinilytica]|uniref:FAD-dependent oxidoreductase n=1 Tax=Inhella gelatinilytica TaxID=2795030 RepID=UPI001FEACDAC|nr:FAD-dependent oxidoreductase [Inhella gelatinilytica]
MTPRIPRRSLLLAGLAPLGACSRPPRALDVQWLGPDPERGHRLRTTPPTGQARARRTEVLVLGAGVAGLSAARALRAAGRQVTVLELDSAPGGHSRAGLVGGLPCPLGAHYLPQPGPQLPELQDLLVEWGAAERRNGVWRIQEDRGVHSPAERRFDGTAWQPGLLPAPPDPQALAQHRRFAQQVAEAQRLGFALPTHRAAFGPTHRALDAQTFDAWLDTQGLTEPGLRWYLDYCCRDDYGAGSALVSAWAGLHYFASRHGFHVAGDDDEPDARPPITAPQGNGWLVERLAAPLQEALITDRVGLQLDVERSGVRLRCWSPEGLEDWHAASVVLAVPLFVAQRLWRSPPAALQAARLQRAPWLVANLLLEGPPLPRIGAPLAWDNVIQHSPTLGYVNAQHQSLDPRPGPQVWTLYWALPAAERPALLSRSASDWAARVLATLTPTHPDLPERLQQLRLTRWGHAMAIPTPGARGQAALVALRQLQGRVRIAHADLAAYSVFEEAFMAGLAAAQDLLHSS